MEVLRIYNGNPASMNLHRVDLVSRSLFSLVARCGSISKGAGLAAIAVGAASKRLADLELSLGAPLFERHSRGITLTPAGEALRQHAQRILSDVDQMAAGLSDYASGLTGVVRLWANTSAVTQFLPAQISSFIRVNPGICIELEEADSQEIVVAVLDGRADLGIFADRTPAGGLAVHRYHQDRLVLVVPVGHPLARRRAVRFDEAIAFDFVTLSRTTSLARRPQSETEALGRKLRVRIQVRSFDAICKMVAAGLGLAVLPDVAAEPLARSLHLRCVALTDDWAARWLLVGVRERASLPRHVRLFLGHLGQEPAES